MGHVSITQTQTKQPTGRHFVHCSVLRIMMKNPSAQMSFNVLFGITILVFLSSPICFGKRVVKEKLNPHFYHKSCPQAETIVQDITWKHVKENPSLAAKILRVHYHDCFVRVYMIQNPRVYIYIYIILLEYLYWLLLSLCVYICFDRVVMHPSYWIPLVTIQLKKTHLQTDLFLGTKSLMK